MKIANADFKIITKLIEDSSGIFLGEDKEYLLCSRLASVMKKHNLPSFNDLSKNIIAKNQLIIKDIVNAMTTNESSFFRNAKPFEQLKNYAFPKLIENDPNKKSFRIWSAACSSGQEPYSIAMTIKECSEMSKFNWEILATDIDNEILNKASIGKYSQFEVQRGMPIMLLMKYFSQDGTDWVVKEDLKKMIKFQEVNLINGLPESQKFDIIMCRNVLIYFNKEVKEGVVNKLAKNMHENSSLFLGSTERTFGMEVNVKQVTEEPGIFILA